MPVKFSWADLCNELLAEYRYALSQDVYANMYRDLRSMRLAMLQAVPQL